MAKGNAPLPPDQRIEFRIGINVGDIVVEDGDIFGDDVNDDARRFRAEFAVLRNHPVDLQISDPGKIDIGVGKCASGAGRHPHPWVIRAHRRRIRVRQTRHLGRDPGESVHWMLPFRPTIVEKS